MVIINNSLTREFSRKIRCLVTSCERWWSSSSTCLISRVFVAQHVVQQIRNKSNKYMWRLSLSLLLLDV